MRPVPCGQLLDAGDSTHGLREFRVPPDNMAADQQSDALSGGSALRCGQLLDMPQPDVVDERSV